MGNLSAVLNGERMMPPPIWLMRQAGRYLPEYRAVRQDAGGFLDLCYNPDLATTVTLQPINRFDFDASILFSDILVTPHALGQKLWFAEGEGPRLEPITSIDGLSAYDPDKALKHLGPVFEAVSSIRAALPAEKDLIGFCGAPWTVASYMVAGRGTKDLAPLRALAESDPAALEGIMDVLVDLSARYLVRQVEAGANVLQIFESWAQVLHGDDFERWSRKPVEAIVNRVKEALPDTPIIVFPRKSGDGYRIMAELPGVSGISIDPDIDLDWVATHVQPHAAIQGNVSPEDLIAGPEAIDAAIEKLAATVAQGPWIANLGHGIQPSTPIAHVEHLVRRLRELSAVT